MSWAFERGGGPYRSPLPDCSTNGPHRWKQAHILPTEKSIVYQTCRVCGEMKYTRVTVEDGKVFVKDVSPSGSNTDHISDGKHPR